MVATFKLVTDYQIHGKFCWIIIGIDLLNGIIWFLPSYACRYTLDHMSFGEFIWVLLHIFESMPFCIITIFQKMVNDRRTSSASSIFHFSRNVGTLLTLRIIFWYLCVWISLKILKIGILLFHFRIKNMNELLCFFWSS